MNIRKRRLIYETLQKNDPDPKTELIYSSPFELLVAVILSAQATDKSVNRATIALFAEANTPSALLALGLDVLKSYIKTINLYPTKAKNLLKTAEILTEKFDSCVPSERNDLESLPGVGRKTANVILNTIFKQPTIAVDTHIFRVCHRTNLAIGATPRDVEMNLLKVTPRVFLLNAHHWLLLHGRYVCTARQPKCPTCLIRDWCEYKDKTL